MHNLWTLIDMAAKGYITEERWKAVQPDADRLLATRCLYNYFTQERRVANIDRARLLGDASLSHVELGLPSLLWVMERWGRWNPERAPTAIILNDEELTLAEARRRYPFSEEEFPVTEGL